MIPRLRRGEMRCIYVIMIVVCSAPLSVFANEGRGYVAFQNRYFWQQALYPEQTDNQASIAGWYEYYRDNAAGNQRFNFSVFGRLDAEDDERSHVDVRELYFWRAQEDFEFYLGVRKIFWGVTESAHLVDIINQDDLLENPDGEEKLGQPMLQLISQRDWGLLELFVLPWFREKQYSGSEGRLRPALPILDEALYQSGAEEKHVDVAFRWSHYFSVWDIGLSHFSGTSRDPFFTPVIDGGAATALQANYQQIEQTGLALQATVEAWLYKLEAISIDERDYGRNSAATFGAEYTFFSVAASNTDLGVIAEYQWDDRSGLRQQLAQNDVAFGLRWAFNDLDGSEVLALVNQDLDYSNRFYSLELSRRITDNLKVEAEARIFSQMEAGTFEYQLRQDDYLQIELRYYF